MSNASCVREDEVINAVKSHHWTSELSAHVQTCSVCSETVAVATSLQQLAARTSAEIEIPVQYRILWLRARFTRKQERLSKLDRLMLLGAFAVVMIAASGIILWKWQLVRSWSSFVPAEPTLQAPFYIVIGCAALIWFLTEELFSRDA